MHFMLKLSKRILYEFLTSATHNDLLHYRRNRLNLGDDIPLVVLQWESLIAVSYPARKWVLYNYFVNVLICTLDSESLDLTS
jgi:hypothetical protein